MPPSEIKIALSLTLRQGEVSANARSLQLVQVVLPEPFQRMERGEKQGVGPLGLFPVVQEDGRVLLHGLLLRLLLRRGRWCEPYGAHRRRGVGPSQPRRCPRALLLLGCEVGLDGCVRLLLLRGRGRKPRGHRESHGADPVLGSSGLRAGMLGQGKGALAAGRRGRQREVVPAGQRARGGGETTEDGCAVVSAERPK